jgi:hypothetical protein
MRCDVCGSKKIAFREEFPIPYDLNNLCQYCWEKERDKLNDECEDILRMF